jgi:putative membrane protein
MWTDAILAYLHFAAIFALVWFLASEWTLLRAGAGALDTERLARADGWYGRMAGVVVLTGAARAIYGLKGWSFHAHNPAFHFKIGVFVLVALLSIKPTVAFLRWRKAHRADPGWRVAEPEWRSTRRWVMVELHLIALIPLAAVLMSRGLP